MNLNRDLTKSISSSEGGNINMNWLIGLIEGDGTFGIKNRSPYLQIAQKNTNEQTLNAIKTGGNSHRYISTNYRCKASDTINISSPNVTSSINKKTNVISLVINNIDSLYYYILPKLEESEMYSRKSIDFKL